VEDKMIQGWAQKLAKAQGAEFQAAYYNKGSRDFVLKSWSKRWMNLTEAQYRRKLKSVGFNPKPSKGSYASEVDDMMELSINTKDVEYAGGMSGYKEGFYEDCGYRFLVTSAPNLPEPKPGEWPMLESIMGQLFNDYEQYVHAWLKIAYEALAAGRRRPGQVLVMCGPHGCGKSLFQNLITIMLGGRTGKPYQFMTGNTDFNGDLFAAEHLMIEDEVASTDLRSRRHFGAMIKNFTVNEEQRCHPKNKQGFMCRPQWRISISLNDEPENLMILPPLDGSIEDKMIILRVYKAEMPMPTITMDQRTAFWDGLKAEIPAFLHYLLNWEVPEDMRCERYGVKHVHDGTLIQSIDALSPEMKLLQLLDGEVSIYPWVGTPTELEHMLTSEGSGVYREANKLLSYPSAAGQYLGRLANKMPERVSFESIGGHRKKYTIRESEE
jgi:hypothetical protein